MALLSSPTNCLLHNANLTPTNDHEAAAASLNNLLAGQELGNLPIANELPPCTFMKHEANTSPSRPPAGPNGNLGTPADVKDEEFERKFEEWLKRVEEYEKQMHHPQAVHLHQFCTLTDNGHNSGIQDSWMHNNADNSDCGDPAPCTAHSSHSQDQTVPNGASISNFVRSASCDENSRASASHKREIIDVCLECVRPAQPEPDMNNFNPFIAECEAFGLSRVLHVAECSFHRSMSAGTQLATAMSSMNTSFPSCAAVAAAAAGNRLPSFDSLLPVEFTINITNTSDEELATPDGALSHSPSSSGTVSSRTSGSLSNGAPCNGHRSPLFL